MFIWLAFYSLEIILLYLAFCVGGTKKQKKILYGLSLFVALYFSAFRDGLGTDYQGYVEKLGWSTKLELQFENEIFFVALSKIIESTILSPIFYFFVCSLVTVFGIWEYLSDEKNTFKFLGLLIFLSMPGMFFNTFNLTRQFFSTAIFLYSLKFINAKKILKYTICILIAMMMHTSAIILWPLYFVLNKQYKLVAYFTFFIVAFILVYSLEPIITSIALFSGKYGLYVNTDEVMKSSTIVIICNIMVGYYMFFINRKQNEKMSSYMTMGMNLFILFTVFSNLSYINFFFFRISIYFIPAVCLAIPYILYKMIHSRDITSVICIVFALVYFLSFIINNFDNSIVCPDAILWISSLFD